MMHFDPSRYHGDDPTAATEVRAHRLLARPGDGPGASAAAGTIDGFVVERPIAGGHNAPPRGQFDARRATAVPTTVARDRVDYDVLRSLERALLDRRRRDQRARRCATPSTWVRPGSRSARSSPTATSRAWNRTCGTRSSPTRSGADSVEGDHVDRGLLHRLSLQGGPMVAGTIADEDLYAARERKCDLGYLRDAYVQDGRHHRLPLLGRAGRRLRAQGRAPRPTPSARPACATPSWRPADSRRCAVKRTGGATRRHQW
jgi:hypothetical protein